MLELFYNFCFADQNQGYYKLQQSDDLLLSETKFFQPDGELYTNIFRLKLKAGKVLAYQYLENDWVDFRHQPEDSYPSSAYPLLLARVSAEPWKYNCVFEHDGSSVPMTIFRQNNLITEFQGETLNRSFSMKGDLPISIDWGGPVSQLCSNFEDAILNSPVERLT